MKKLIIICLLALTYTCTYAQEPTKQDAIDFICKTIKKHFRSKFNGEDGDISFKYCLNGELKFDVGGNSDVVVSVFTDKWSPIISEDTDKWSPIISEDTDNNVSGFYQVISLMLLSVSSLTNGVRLSVKTLTTT